MKVRLSLAMLLPLSVSPYVQHTVLLFKVGEDVRNNTWIFWTVKLEDFNLSEQFSYVNVVDDWKIPIFHVSWN